MTVAAAMAGAMSFLGILDCRLQLRVPLLSLALKSVKLDV